MQQALAPDSTGSEGWTEAKAIREAQNGCHAGFEFLYNLHSKRVYAICLRMTGNPSVAEDLTQNAFMQLFRKINSFRGDSAFSTWLHRITVNVVLMSFRKKTLPEVSLEGTDTDNEDRDHFVEVGSRDGSLESGVDRVNLQRAISQLAPGYREIFILHDVLGYEHNEIAGILHCSIGNSKSQLYKARLRLRAALLGNEGDARRPSATEEETPPGAVQSHRGQDTRSNSKLENSLLCPATPAILRTAT